MTRRPGDVVVVIEDDYDTREALGDVLRLSGYEVVAAENGRKALDLLHAVPALRPCVILLDIMMPVMDGRQFRALQRDDPELGTIPVVVMTAHVDHEEARRSLAADAFLKKPVHIDALLDTVAQFCRKPQPSA
jgi:CheY-like chemotaxis protein